MKKIAIINGNPKPENKKFEKYLETLSSSLVKKGNRVNMIKLKKMKLNFCIGCYSCWLKTPGVCIHKDDGPKILTEYINSDVVILSSPLIMGFTSALIKTLQERLIALSHPFVYIKDDRMQHVLRYEKYPSTVLLLEKTGIHDETDIEITENIYKSAKTRKFALSLTTDRNCEEVADEINNI